MHALDLFLLKLDVKGGGRSLALSVSATFTRRHQPVTVVVASCLSALLCKLSAGIAFSIGSRIVPRTRIAGRLFLPRLLIHPLLGASSLLIPCLLRLAQRLLQILELL